MRRLLAVPLLLAAAPPPPAVPPQPLTIERIFSSPSLSGPSPRLARLSPDGAFATLLKARSTDSERYDLWAIDTATGAERMLVDSTKFGGGPISEAEKMRRERARVGGTKGIVDYEWAPDGKSILVPVDGDLYLATLDGAIRRLTDTPATELDAHVSKDGRYVSFVRDRNLYAIDLSPTGHEFALTTDGKGTVTCGTAEFVAQEELERRTGHWWAPGDGRIAIECFDEAPVREVTRAAIGAEGTTTYTQRYPLAGTPNVRVSLIVTGPDGAKPVRVDLGADPDIYLARVDWSPDARTLYVQRLSRDQKRLDMLRVDPATGASAVLFSETAPTWVDLTRSFHALKDGSLIWASQRDGYRHLYRYADGRWTQLTRGRWMVDEVVGLDQEHHRLIFTGNPATPIEQQVLAVDYLNPAEPARLTESGWWNEAEMDDGARRMLVRRSNRAQPTQVYLADAAGRRLRWIEPNPVATGPYAPFAAAEVPTTFGTLAARDGSTLHYRLTKPAVDDGRRHPVFVEVYGGPAGQTATRQWGSDRQLFEQYLARKGWVIFSLDNRGSPRRGTAFEHQIYEKAGTVEVEDQLTGLDWLKRQPFVDPAKVAVFGWSNGGYMTLRLLEKAPHAYAAGVAVAPVTEWELYDTAYTERYNGDPRRVPQAYRAADLIADAPKIADPLLVMHGMADDNVFFDNSVALFSALQSAEVPFDMMVYPGKTHAISGNATRTHLFGTIERFLNRAVLGGGHGTSSR